jgi:hypothetical protein
VTCISDDTTVRRSAEGVVASNIDGEVVMMNIEDGAYYTLNGIASRIWELIEDPFRVSRLVERLLEEFAVDRRTCAEETVQFLEELRKIEVLRVTPG